MVHPTSPHSAEAATTEEKAAPFSLDNDAHKRTPLSANPLSLSSLDTSALPHKAITVNTLTNDDDDDDDDESSSDVAVDRGTTTTTSTGSTIVQQIKTTVSSLASTPRFMTSSGPRLRNFDYCDPGTPALPVPPRLEHMPSLLNLHATSSTGADAGAKGVEGEPAVWKVYVALILAQLCWSGFHVLGKYTFSFLSPFVLPTFRSLGTIPLFAFYAYRKDPSNWYVMSPRNHALMVLEGLLGNTIAQQFFNLGTSLSSAALAGMLQPCIPVFTSVLAIALKREGVSGLKIGGICVAILGSSIMVLGSTGETSSESPHTALGAVCFLVQCLTTSVYIIIQKPMFADGVATHTFTFYLFLYGGVGHVIVGSFFLPSMDWANLPLQLFFPILLYVVVVASFIAFSLFVFATNHLPASISSLGITCQSVFSPTLGAIFLGEVVSWENVVGGVAIFAGIVIVVVAKGREGNAAAAAAEAARDGSAGKDVDGWHEARSVDIELSRRETITEGDDEHAADGSDDGSEDEAIEDVSLNANGSDADVDDEEAEGGEWDEDGYVERGGRVLSEEHSVSVQRQ